MPIVNAAAVVKTLAHGEIVLLLNQYVYLGQGKTIRSNAQIEHNRNKVDGRSNSVGCKQCIVMLKVDVFRCL